MLKGRKATLCFGNTGMWELNEDGLAVQGDANALELLAHELKRSAREDWK